MSISLPRFQLSRSIYVPCQGRFRPGQPPSFWHRLRLPRFKLKRCQLFCFFSFLYVLGDFFDDCFAVRCPRSQIETSRSKACISFTIKFKGFTFILCSRCHPAIQNASRPCFSYMTIFRKAFCMSATSPSLCPLNRSKISRIPSVRVRPVSVQSFKDGEVLLTLALA